LSRLPGKRARPVLRGPRRSNAPGLPDERWFAELTTKLLQRGVHTSVQALEADIRNWINTWNQKVPRQILWVTESVGIMQVSRW